MKRAARIIRFGAVMAAVWLMGAAEWPLSEILGLLGDAGCC
jgi:hypothetical protein